MYPFADCSSGPVLPKVGIEKVEALYSPTFGIRGSFPHKQVSTPQRGKPSNTDEANAAGANGLLVPAISTNFAQLAAEKLHPLIKGFKLKTQETESDKGDAQTA